MAKLHVRAGAWVVVADGRKCLILQNDGDDGLINLRRMSAHEHKSDANHDQGTERPSRVSSGVPHRSGAVGGTDWHQMDETAFAKEIEKQLETAMHEKSFKHLVIVAPPKTLAELRKQMSKELQSLVQAEINKDLTGHPLPEIEKILGDHDMD